MNQESHTVAASRCVRSSPEARRTFQAVLGGSLVYWGGIISSIFMFLHREILDHRSEPTLPEEQYRSYPNSCLNDRKLSGRKLEIREKHVTSAERALVFVDARRRPDHLASALPEWIWVTRPQVVHFIFCAFTYCSSNICIWLRRILPLVHDNMEWHRLFAASYWKCGYYKIVLALLCLASNPWQNGT